MSEIMINPEEVEAKAAEMKQLTAQMKSKVEEVHATANSLKSVWQDVSMEGFEGDFTKLTQSFAGFLEEVPTFINQANQHAEDMRKIGQNA